MKETIPAGMEERCGSSMLEGERRYRSLIMSVLPILLVLVLVLAMGLGAVALPARQIAAALLEPVPCLGSWIDDGPGEINSVIIWQIRLPRVLLGALVGSALAVAGTTFQGLFKNPMADPFVIGVSSGAALGATVAMLMGLHFPALGVGMVPLMAFSGALGTMFLVYNLARVGHKVPVLPLLVSGIAVSSFLSALVSLLVYFSDEKIHQVVFWLMGGFSGASWGYVRLSLPYMVAGTAVVLLFTRELNVLLSGEEKAAQLGVDVERTKKILLAAGSLLTASAVATSGLIGFVGLIVPHLARLVLGPDHRWLLPAAAMSGAIFLVGADGLARTIVAPTELPVGVITALCGGPFFLYLLRRRKSVGIPG